VNEPELIDEMLRDMPRSIAVIGLSDRPDRPSFYVSAYMQQHGYSICPVNPSISRVLNEPSYAALADLPVKPTIVNVFRVASVVSAVIDEMLPLGLLNLWVQQGIVNLEAARRAEEAGIRVVMDRCIMIEHRRSFSVA